MSESTLKPFHESIVDAINRAEGEGVAVAYALAELIKGTKIPKGHDAIIEAWSTRVARERRDKGWAYGNLGIPESVKAQKAAAERPETCHPSHETRSSDASTYDVVCKNCGATDVVPGGWGKLAEPCPEA